MNELGGGGWSELGMYWEAGVGANWECIERRGRSKLGIIYRLLQFLSNHPETFRIFSKDHLQEIAYTNF